MSNVPKPPPFDSIHKALVVETTSHFGHGESEHEIERGTSRVDVWFEPARDGPDDSPLPEALTLWRALAQGRCLIECFSTTPSLTRMTDVVTKLLCKERALRKKVDAIETVSLFVLSPGKPRRALAQWGARPHTESPWPKVGVHRLAMPDVLEVTVLVLSELPQTRQTLLFRLLGRGEVQRLALLELAELKEPWTVNIKDILIQRQIMTSMPNTEPTEVDLELARNMKAVAQQFVDDLKSEGKIEGKLEARLSILARQLQLRLQRPLHETERATLERLVGEIDQEELADKVILLSPQELEAWLAG